MEKLRALTDYLAGLKWCNPERMHTTAQDGAPEWAQAETGADLLLFRHRYTGVIELEGVAGDVRDLLAAVLVWLHDNGGEEDVLESWEGEPLDSKRSDVMLRLTFEEAVHYIPAPPGYAGPDRVVVNGATYQRGDKTPDRLTDPDNLTLDVSI